MTADRKREAREKFLLGGIVVRAGLSKADRAFLLGGLLELARVAPDSPEHRRLRDMGEEAFKGPSSAATETRTWETAEWH
ncbi:conjugal transfer protein TraD [Ensifer sp. B1-9]|uniref:conjugal transfer protein TraD n=1 Tax=Ensifer sp. B1-9 TaxID=3141455 RepID=UPI003D23A09F